MIKEKLEKILRQVAEVEEIEDFEVLPHIDVLRGDGFMGEFYTGEVKNKKTGSIIQAYVKLPPTVEIGITSQTFFNELRFYSVILPELNNFIAEKDLKIDFNSFPKFYSGECKSDNTYIVLENLKLQNYVLYDKSKYLDQDHLRAIFDIYGKFHAITFAFKDQNLERHLELTGPLKDIITYDEDKGFMAGIKSSFEQAYNILKDIDIKTASKVKPYVKDLNKAVLKAMAYKGTFSALTHGDCWSNNMLFKYGEDGTIENIKLLDFQLPRDSTPIHDLSYFFYSGASKEDFDKLDEYLEIYYKSFSTVVKKLGSDPEKCLPLHALKSEWKTYSLLGVFMGIMLWQVKLLDKEVIKNMSSGDPKSNIGEKIQKIYKSDAFKKNTSDILIHAVEYGIL